MPTVLGVLGLPRPVGIDGLDLRGLWTEPQEQPTERWLFAEAGPTLHKDTRRSVRDRRHKLILELESDRLELYDLVEDPEEVRNLVEARPKLLRTLRAALEPFMHSGTDAPGAAALSPAEEARLRALGYIVE